MQTEIVESGGHQDVVPTQVNNDRLPALMGYFFLFCRGTLEILAWGVNLGLYLGLDYGHWPFVGLGNCFHEALMG